MRRGGQEPNCTRFSISYIMYTVHGVRPKRKPTRSLSPTLQPNMSFPLPVQSIVVVDVAAEELHLLKVRGCVAVTCDVRMHG